MRAYVPMHLVVPYAIFAWAAALGMLQAAAVASGDRRLAAFILPGRPRASLAAAGVWVAGAYAIYWRLAPELLTPGPAGSELTALFGLSALLAWACVRLVARLRGNERPAQPTPLDAPTPRKMPSRAQLGTRSSLVSVGKPPAPAPIPGAARPRDGGGEPFPTGTSLHMAWAAGLSLLTLLVSLYDWPLFRALNSLAGRHAVLDAALQFLMNDYILPSALALTLVGLWFAGSSPAERAHDQAAVRRALFAMLLSNALLQVANAVYFRPRPFTNYEASLLFYHPSDSSFPSNAAAMSFSLALGVWLSHKRWGTWLLALASAISLARVCGGVHYPLDVVAGAWLGGLSACLVKLSTGWIEPPAWLDQLLARAGQLARRLALA